MSWIPTGTGTSKDEEALISSSSALDDLTSIAPLILDVDLRDQVLARYDGPRRLVAEDALQFAGQLMQVTGWSGEQLLGNLGCELTVAELNDVDLKRLERCKHLLRLISRLTGLVDTLADKRAVVIECAGLLEDTRYDALALTRIIETATSAGGMRVTPVDYIRLGEISAAADLAKRIAQRDANAAEGCAAADSPGPFDSVPAAHLSTTRIEIYNGPNREVLGAEVSLCIAAHLEECESCSRAVEYCLRHNAPTGQPANQPC
jgi:hypothetical protein